MSGPLAPEIRGRQTMQLAAHDFSDLTECGLVALPPVVQQEGHGEGCRGGHSTSAAIIEKEEGV
jgi:hypothetical protein